MYNLYGVKAKILEMTKQLEVMMYRTGSPDLGHIDPTVIREKQRRTSRRDHRSSCRGLSCRRQPVVGRISAPVPAYASAPGEETLLR